VVPAVKHVELDGRVADNIATRNRHTKVGMDRGDVSTGTVNASAELAVSDAALDAGTKEGTGSGGSRRRSGTEEGGATDDGQRGRQGNQNAPQTTARSRGGLGLAAALERTGNLHRTIPSGNRES